MYTYIDGNNNTYTITRDRVRYEPVAPEHSSSGMYSGGAPADAELPPDAFATLETLIDVVLDDTAHHIADRVKGCGTLISGTMRVLCAASSPHKQELERELRLLVGVR